MDWVQAMRCGNFEAAWAASDQVLAARDPAQRDDPSLPYHLRWVWDGRPFDGRRVLVRCYHGLGDTLQFCRYLAPLRRRAASLVLEVQPELIPLLQTLPGPDRLDAFRPAAPSAPLDCDIEIMELAHALRLRPDPGPYLPNPGRARAAGPVRAGLCWHVASTWQPERSVPLPLLAPLGRIHGVEWVSLQRGSGAAQLDAPGPLRVVNKQDRSTSMTHTAGLLAGLDLVVTIDTMVAHLAGAMGVPTWLLLLADPDWRWQAGGRGSPWYGSVRTYRQPSPGDWATPIAALAADLTQWAEGNSLAAGTRSTGPGL